MAVKPRPPWTPAASIEYRWRRSRGDAVCDKHAAAPPLVLITACIGCRSAVPREKQQSRSHSAIITLAGLDCGKLDISTEARRKELQTETRAESRRARIATKRLQGAVRKVAKSRTEIEEKLNTMEDRTTAVEADVKALKEQLESHGGQLTDIMWKLEDQDNRQRRNNLRFLGIEEGV
ncbi:hypothetical protein NDU88_004487 [Pleurodeles waltl]|uniref:BZIP domain-containing protein n=1 Tax=Pleurodeles waltl TaxID=8319 RepID=A0AAV7RGD8_PLEWA|nr:hypothetical protein NDU88_004487 [Pleurodeles waltl]